MINLFIYLLNNSFYYLYYFIYLFIILNNLFKFKYVKDLFNLCFS